MPGDASALLPALGLALAAGLSVPMGGWLSSHVPTGRFVRRKQLDSFMSYFGGGALLAAIALVLVPRGLEQTPLVGSALAFAAGGATFWRFSVWTERTDNAASQFAGMVLDYVPEALLLGAAAVEGASVIYLLAALIALQNLPEGFAAHHELEQGGVPPARVRALFLAAPLAGPLAAWLGFAVFADHPTALGALLLFCSGGILYLIVEDVAPRAHLEREAFPALGSVSGFLLGMLGTELVH